MHPYETLDAKYFWATAVANRDMLDIDQLWVPKFNIGKKQRIATFGSCFAQHIGRALQNQGYAWASTEPAPPGLSDQNARRFNYDIFTCRTGNIYTTSLLRQWVSWACGREAVPDEIWKKDGRFYDPFRPAIEPEGFASKQELLASRDFTIRALRRALSKVRVFVFTLGLTESWFNKQQGYEYPMCPGTVAGEFDPRLHEFKNQDHGFVLKNLRQAIKMIREINPKMRFILTVSPVPLTATNSGTHVLVATQHSKAILRSVAGQLAASRDYIDYFPSYEVVTTPPFRGAFFEQNQRSVTPQGVAHIMGMFFQCLEARFGDSGAVAPVTQRSPGKAEKDASEADLVCEEELLSAFGPSA